MYRYVAGEGFLEVGGAESACACAGCGGRLQMCGDCSRRRTFVHRWIISGLPWFQRRPAGVRWEVQRQDDCARVHYSNMRAHRKKNPKNMTGGHIQGTAAKI